MTEAERRRLDPRDQAHLDAAIARDPAQAAALRRHFEEQRTSARALRAGRGGRAGIPNPRPAEDG
ncbi:MAG TPA: hypothetical protein VE081_01620 [Sporichthyaceae bacterium]|nr:hypothetical protein [Sporichthyaceae bacterium]